MPSSGPLCAASTRPVGGSRLPHGIGGNDLERVEPELAFVVDGDPIQVRPRDLLRGRAATFHVAAELAERLLDHVVIRGGHRLRRLGDSRLRNHVHLPAPAPAAPVVVEPACRQRIDVEVADRADFSDRQAARYRVRSPGFSRWPRSPRARRRMSSHRHVDPAPRSAAATGSCRPGS